MISPNSVHYSHKWDGIHLLLGNLQTFGRKVNVCISDMRVEWHLKYFLKIRNVYSTETILAYLLSQLAALFIPQRLPDHPSHCMSELQNSFLLLCVK